MIKFIALPISIHMMVIFVHPLCILTGDHFYKRNKEKSDKEQMITALPEIMTETIQEEDEFMVLACDGIW